MPRAADRWQLTPLHLLEVLGVTVVALVAAYLFYLLTERHTNRVRALILGTRKATAARSLPPERIDTL